jgi:hypothetical protein
MFCGSMKFNLDPLHPLLTMMPEVIRAGDLAQRDPGVPMLLDAMEREASLNRIGACGILARMADVLAASIIRAWVECACSDSTGWITALRSPGVGKVLAAIHAIAGAGLERAGAGQHHGRIAIKFCPGIQGFGRREPGPVRGPHSHVPGPQLDRAGRHARHHRR